MERLLREEKNTPEDLAVLVNQLEENGKELNTLNIWSKEKIIWEGKKRSFSVILTLISNDFKEVKTRIRARILLILMKEMRTYVQALMLLDQGFTVDKKRNKKKKKPVKNTRTPRHSVEELARSVSKIKQSAETLESLSTGSKESILWRGREVHFSTVLDSISKC